MGLLKTPANDSVIVTSLKGSSSHRADVFGATRTHRQDGAGRSAAQVSGESGSSIRIAEQDLQSL